tara:strand:+ start:1190 stop:1720 length:531 start_codon:yes stop_codon:yes gene_type:complete
MNIDKLIDQVLRHEGGFVDDPDDKGGTTNWGISKKVYAKFLGVDSTYIYLSHLIKLMPKETARMIYKEQYYYGPKVNLLPHKLQSQVFDMCVNHGPRNAYKLLQRAINQESKSGLFVDGLFGRLSWAALDAVADKRQLNNALVDVRLAFYRSIVDNNPSQQKFINGWTKRGESFYQ